MTTSPVLQNGAAHPAHTMMAPVAGAPDGEPDIRPEVGRYLVVLKVLSTQLNGTAQQIEQAVVGVCANFQQIAENARKGVSRAAAFLASGKAQDKQRATVAELIEQSRSTFNCLMATLERNAEISRQAVDRMKEVDGQAERISGALKMLESIAEGNHILALNARIEAARAGEFGKGFAVVATEVVAQSDRSRSVINTVSETIRELRGTAASALRDLELQGKQGRESAESQRVQVDQILQAFNDVDREMRSLLRETSSDSEHLSMEIGQAVNKMQFQDRVNQRIAHVVEALDITRERLTTLCGGVESTDTSAVDEILSRYTMKEERSAADAHEEEAAGGEVELF